MNTTRSSKLVVNGGHMLAFAVLALVLVQLWSYWGAQWVLKTSEWSTQVTASQMATNSIAMIVVRYAALATILLVAFRVARFSVTEMIGVVLLITISTIHTVLKFMEVDLITGLYQSNVPLMYLLILAFWIGKNKSCWEKLEKIIPFLLAAYVIAFLLTFGMFYAKYGWAIFQNSPLMNFYGHAFALALPFFYTRLRDKKVGVATYLLLVFFLVGAVIIRSRAWLIQSAILLLIVGAAAARVKGGSRGGFLRVVLLVAIVLLAASWLLRESLSEFADSLIEKGTQDSRSEQYMEMLEQTDWYAWIFGQGADATYLSALYGDYQFIDNEFFYISFHFGVILAIAYFMPFFRTFFLCLRMSRRQKLGYFGAACVLIWVLSVNGLSVFHRISLDVKGIVIPAFMGYLCTDMKALNKGENES